MAKIRTKQGTELFHIMRDQRDDKISWETTKKYIKASDYAYKHDISIDSALRCLGENVSFETTKEVM